jgi:hypothetical protein
MNIDQFTLQQPWIKKLENDSPVGESFRLNNPSAACHPEERSDEGSLI